MEELAELRVPRHAALTRAHDVDRGEVHREPVAPLEALEEARVVVQRDRARVRDAERVERVRHRDLAQAVARMRREQIRERVLGDHLCRRASGTCTSSGISGCMR